MITYETGNPHFEGRTTVCITTEGQGSAERVRETFHEAYARAVDPARYRRLHDLLTRFDPQGLPDKAPVPGETPVTIRLTEGGASGAREVRFWTNARWVDPTLEELATGFETLAREVSGGAIAF